MILLLTLFISSAMMAFPSLAAIGSLVFAYSGMFGFAILAGSYRQLAFLVAVAGVVLAKSRPAEAFRSFGAVHLLFWGWALYSTFKTFTYGYQSGPTLYKLMAISLALCIVTTLRREGQCRTFAYAGAVLSVLLAVYGFGGGIEAGDARVEFEMVSDRNIQGWFLVAGFMPLLAYAVACPSARNWERALAFCCITISATCAIGYGSRGAGLAGAVGVLSVFRKRNIAKTVLLGLVAGYLSWLYLEQSGFLDRYIGRWQDEDVRTGSERIEFVQILLSEYAKLPFLSQLFGAAEAATTMLGRGLVVGQAGTHNGYMTILIENGAIGLLTFVGGFGYFMWRSFNGNAWTGVAKFSLGITYATMNLTLDLNTTLLGWIVLGFLASNPRKNSAVSQSSVPGAQRPESASPASENRAKRPHKQGMTRVQRGHEAGRGIGLKR